MRWGYMLLKKLHAPITEVIIRYLEVWALRRSGQ